MTITVNGKAESVEPLSITAFLETKNIDPKTVVVEQNGTILDKNAYETIILAENDVLEIIRFVGGG